MPIFKSCSIYLVLAITAVAEEPSLAEARLRWLKGNYEEAREIYVELSKNPKVASAAAVGVSKCWQSVGEYDKAASAIADALSRDPMNADVLARLAELQHFRGQWDEAEKAARKAIEARPEHFLAHWVLAQLYRDRGDHTRADAEFRWFVRTYSRRSQEDKDVTDPDELLLIGLAALENARWHRLADQFGFVLTDVYGDALKADKNFWPAEYQAGALLLEKYNRGEALAAFDKGLAINPNAAECLVGKGQAALQKLEIKDADQFADDALTINPRLPEALRLAAEVALFSGDLTTARKHLERARAVNPRDEETLGRVAACLTLEKKVAEFDALCAEVDKRNPKAGVFYFSLAQCLEERRHFVAAETYFKKSATVMPVLSAAQNGLGLLYMRLGREKEAREVLAKAFAADNFNVRVSNTLKVLRHLETYETLKTAHFEIRFDPKKDKTLARYMAPFLESMHAELADKFGYQPAGPILVEVFNNHEMFSGRVVAVPDLHTIGACTGRMIALVSPRGKGVSAPFNWARVMRHELVHIFNLEQTNFQVPHWFTEGLAVSNEGFPRPHAWNRLLATRVKSGDLLNLETINLGFMRPRSPLEWTLAYCQSLLYVDYIKQKHGPKALGDLLAAYRDGLDTPAAIERVCKTPVRDFEKGYRAYLDDLVRPWSFPDTEKKLSLKELEAAVQKDPTSDEAAARLADRYLQMRNPAKARKLVDDVLNRTPEHALATYVKARLLQSAGEQDEARTLLESAVKAAEPEPRAVMALAEMLFEAREFAPAAELFERGGRLEPMESKWLLKLANAYGEGEDKPNQIEVLKKVAPTDADNLDVRRKLANLLLEAGKPEEAERYARQALEIDVGDESARETLLASLREQKKIDEAERTRALLQE